MESYDDDPQFSWIGSLAIMVWIASVIFLGRTFPLHINKYIWLVLNSCVGFYFWHVSPQSGTSLAQIILLMLMSYWVGKLFLWEMRRE